MTSISFMYPQLPLLKQNNLLKDIYPFCIGLLYPFGFAPFHFPGLSILSITMLYCYFDRKKTAYDTTFSGFCFGLGSMGLGVSWIYISIHDFGELNFIVSGLLTFLFLGYLSLFYAMMGYAYQRLSKGLSHIFKVILFSCLWFWTEVLRSTLFGGFPWLLLGTSQLQSPIQHLMPIIGILGISCYTALIAGLIGEGIMQNEKTKPAYRFMLIMIAVLMIILPKTFPKHWVERIEDPIQVSIIQPNESMRNKWDNGQLLKILEHHKNKIKKLTPKSDLIILPESAIPIPLQYSQSYLSTLEALAVSHDAGIFSGIPDESIHRADRYHNALLGLGQAHGIYHKQHLVPFGEYIPKTFQTLSTWLGLDIPTILPGDNHQPLIQFKQYDLASLICYEVAYPELVRAQLPQASWIISVSDDGWFGHSLAIYQHVQMAQVLSKITGRGQILANNDGLSAIINEDGSISGKLKTHAEEILTGQVYPAKGRTPWAIFGDAPIIFLNACLIFFLIGLRLTIAAKHKRRYANHPY